MYPRIAGMMRNVEKKGSIATISGHRNDPLKRSWSIFRSLVRNKKHTFLAQMKKEIYELFLSQDSKEAWRLIQEHNA